MLTSPNNKHINNALVEGYSILDSQDSFVKKVENFSKYFGKHGCFHYFNSLPRDEEADHAVKVHVSIHVEDIALALHTLNRIFEANPDSFSSFKMVSLRSLNNLKTTSKHEKDDQAIERALNVSNYTFYLRKNVNAEKLYSIFRQMEKELQQQKVRASKVVATGDVKINAFCRLTLNTIKINDREEISDSRKKKHLQIRAMQIGSNSLVRQILLAQKRITELERQPISKMLTIQELLFRKNSSSFLVESIAHKFQQQVKKIQKKRLSFLRIK